MAAQAANDPKVLAVRVRRPAHAPEFGTDQKGNLVALIHDLEVEVPGRRPASEQQPVRPRRCIA